jgi:hypothetical protein
MKELKKNPVRGWVNGRAIARLEVLGKLKEKNRIILNGIEPATFQLLGYYHNQLRYLVKKALCIREGSYHLSG